MVMQTKLLDFTIESGAPRALSPRMGLGQLMDSSDAANNWRSDALVAREWSWNQSDLPWKRTRRARDIEVELKPGVPPNNPQTGH
jgi:hypothetical protein